MKLLQEIKGFAEVTNRRPQTKSPALFLMQLRTHLGRKNQPTYSYRISIQVQDRTDIPHPVRITYVTKPAATEPAEVLPAA